jgi:NADPH:quinone reductase-like Zn-dependent oxidoreductase
MGAFQQYVLVDDASLVAKVRLPFFPMRDARPTLAAFQIPDNLSFDQASTVPLGLATAAVAFYQKKKERGGLELVAPWVQGGHGKYAGQAIFITGGASSVGQYGTPLPFHARFDNEIYLRGKLSS